MPTQELAVGQVVENPDLTLWHFADEHLPIRVVREYVFARALHAPLGPNGEELEYPPLRYLSEDVHTLDAYWRDGAAVVVTVNVVTREAHAIVRHGECFRLIRLCEQAKP